MPRCDIPAPKNSLVSFFYFRDFDLDNLSNLRIIGDSGAYSARVQGVEISNDDLGKWAQQWQHRLAWVACLDIARDPLQTRYNWEYLCNEYGIDAVSSIHFGTPPEEISWYAERGVDFLGIGGTAGGVESKKAVLRWLVAVFKYAQKNHPEMRFHGWGITSKSFMRLPFFSVDSSSWGSSYRYGQMILRHPRTYEKYLVTLNGKSAFEKQNALLLSNHYGVAPSEVSLSKSENRHKIVRLSALSASVQEQQFRRMHGPISYPEWGRLGGAFQDRAGPHLHIAEGHHKHLEYVNELHNGPYLHLADASHPNMHNLDFLASGGQIGDEESA